MSCAATIIRKAALLEKEIKRKKIRFLMERVNFQVMKKWQKICQKKL